MRIAVVSRSWPSHERSGVTLAAAEHVRILAAAGHEISLIGAHQAVLHEPLPVSSRIHLPAHGSGALYSPARVDRVRLTRALESCSVDLVIMEGWQTALTDAAVETAASLGLPTLMISHGSSLHSFTPRPVDVLRALGWLAYRRIRLPQLIASLSALTTLDETSASPRFYDRDLARRLGVAVVPLTNTTANWTPYFRERAQRQPQILVVGYFSSVKNQLAALELAARLPSELQFLFVGPRHGRYFDRCLRRSRELGLTARTRFAEDHECDLADVIARSVVVLSISITEALPITLIEAMAAGTPFVATPVGAVPSLRGGILATDIAAQQDAVQALVTDRGRWQRHSDEGRSQFAEHFSREHVQTQLLAAVDAALREGPCGARASTRSPMLTENNASDPSIRQSAAP